ncbi:hypothetical protein [Mycolicibacterium phocaicum]|jgi:hypothetical protein|uniref:hypothetical protein n=1 Tax=Mycolicibacterium phocaicum TaxID=319706 RepID=UPI001CF92FC3|nr:hypothetical protein [Mycolicibacterium phocaicum]UCZ58634.1 hypothetical protein LHJ73_17825 [Mycolicibacterium phocaicum]
MTSVTNYSKAKVDDLLAGKYALPVGGMPLSDMKVADLDARFTFGSRGSGQRLPELWSSFVGLADGTAPTAFTTGQAASTFRFSTGTELMRPVINDGALYSGWSAAGTAAGYYRGQLSGNVTRIGQRFRFKPNTAGSPTVAGGAAMAICRTQLTDAGVPTMALHFVVSPTLVQVGFWNGADEPGADGLTNVVAQTFSNQLRVDDRSEYEMEAWIDTSVSPARLRWEVRSADARRVILGGELTDSRLTSYAGPHVFFENFANAGNTDNWVKISHVWADTKATHGPKQEYQPGTYGSRAATQADVTLTASTPYGYAPLFNFVAPPSGAVKINTGCYLSKPTNATIAFFAVATQIDGTSTTASLAEYVPTNADNAQQGRHEVSGVLDGLTPGGLYQMGAQVMSNKSDTVLKRSTSGGLNAYCTVEPLAGSK